MRRSNGRLLALTLVLGLLIVPARSALAQSAVSPSDPPPAETNGVGGTDPIPINPPGSQVDTGSEDDTGNTIDSPDAPDSPDGVGGTDPIPIDPPPHITLYEVAVASAMVLFNLFG